MAMTHCCPSYGCGRVSNRPVTLGACNDPVHVKTPAINPEYDERDAY